MKKFESEDIIDSRDIIERLEELRQEKEYHESEDEDEKLLSVWDNDLSEELEELEKLESECEGSADWLYGETLINEDYFTEYIKQLIEDCYEMPAEFDSGNWPWCYMEMDWEAAAEAAEVDYMYVELYGNGYLIRA